MMSQIEVTVLAASAVLAAGVLWVPAVCLIRRALHRRRMRRGGSCGAFGARYHRPALMGALIPSDQRRGTALLLSNESSGGF
jgi:hypothetical protein